MAPGQVESNPALAVYDTSGPYTDPAVKIDIRSGLAPLRAAWIEERGDTEDLGGPSSRFGVERLADPEARPNCASTCIAGRAAQAPEPT